ncbi:MAG TPA: universal stress protein [Trebonia sp.]|nr:universal stress protein [Trebonia sp.]
MSRMPVVVGVDGSEESLHAAEWAAWEAMRREVPLRIVSAPAPPPMRSPHVSEATMTNALRGMAARSLALAVERVGEVAHGLPVKTGIVSGPPAIALAGCGQGASVLVLGARGSGGLGAMMVGSVSRHGAAHAPCPVVVVREDTTAVMRKVAVGIRDPQDAHGALAFAFEEAALRNADLLVVHAWHLIPPVVMSRAGQAYDPEMVSGAAMSLLEDVLAAWQDKYPAVKAFPEVVNGHPAQVLASLSARADLLVIGKHAHRGHVIGSIQNAVLIHAHGPVAVVPSAA